MRFACDVMLGKLAKYLRLLGLDAVYLRSFSDLRKLEDGEPLIFITRRTKPLRYPRTVTVHSDQTRQQVSELKALLKPLIDPTRVLNRCIECNVPLEDVDKNEVEHRVPEFVFHYYSRFKKCPSCSRVYWEGSHAQRMSELVKELLD